MITLFHDRNYKRKKKNIKNLFLTFVFIYTEKCHAKLSMETMVSNIWNNFFFKVKFKKFKTFTNRIATFSQFIQQKCISDPSCYFEQNKLETVFNLHWIVGHKKFVLFSMVKKFVFFLLIIINHIAKTFFLRICILAK